MYCSPTQQGLGCVSALTIVGFVRFASPCFQHVAPAFTDAIVGHSAECAQLPASLPWTLISFMSHVSHARGVLAPYILDTLCQAIAMLLFADRHLVLPACPEF